MSTMNVSLPDQMKQWIDSKIEEGQYHNVSEYVRALIRKDQAEHEKLIAFRAAITHGRTSGVDKRDFKTVIKNAKSKARKLSGPLCDNSGRALRTTLHESPAGPG